MLHVVPSPVRCLIRNECSWPGSLQFVGPFPLLQPSVAPCSVGPVQLLSLLVSATLLVERFLPVAASGLYHLLPPSEMVAYLLQSMAPSEMAAYLLHSSAPSELAAYWKQPLVLLASDALLDEVINGALLWPRQDGSRLFRKIQLAGRVAVRPVLVRLLPRAALTSSDL